jgi:predicted transposase YdaD
MNIAQFLREEGMAKGLSQGLSQGLTQGRTEGIQQEALRIAKTMLENGMDPVTVSRLTGLAPDIVEQARH